jgi:NAD(P)-dependent dehydrogenase (short-subunit alcohol dehydrogenase family)
MQIANKVVFVTGGASGIGRGLSERFARDGAKRVFVADVDDTGGEQAAAVIGGKYIHCDVSDEAQVRSAIAEAEKDAGPIDLYCSNAGIAFADANRLVSGSSNADWTKIWEVNLMAHVYATRALLPSMIERGAGYFLITASAAGLLTQVGSTAYSVTKHAAVAFGESLAITHGEQGIGVSVFCPQGVWTNMTRWVKESPRGADAMKSPDEVAEIVVKGLAEERFLIVSHSQTQEYFQRKAADYDGWIRGMRRYRTKLRERARKMAAT